MPAERQPEQLNIVLVIGHLAPGGTRAVCETLARALVAAGHRVKIVSLYLGLGAGEPPDGTLVFNMSPRGRPFDLLRSGFRLRRFLATSGADAVISFLPVANVIGGVVARLGGVRARIATQHSPAHAQRRILDWVDRILGRLNVYTDVVCVSRSVAESFHGHGFDYARLLRIIDNGIDAVLVPQQDRTALRAQLGIPEDVILFGALGRLAPEKNLRSALRALSYTRGVSLLLVGEGPSRQELEQDVTALGIAKRVLFVGGLDHDVAIRYLAACDAFLQVSHYEGRSIAVLEAMALGLPMILSDIPSLREMIVRADGRTAGVLCNPDDPRNLAARMEELAACPQLRAELGRMATLQGAGSTSQAMAKAYVSHIAAALA